MQSSKSDFGLFSHFISFYKATAFLGWFNDLRFNVIFITISIISERWAGDNERPCAVEPRLKRSPPQAGLEPGNARSVGQRLTY